MVIKTLISQGALSVSGVGGESLGAGDGVLNEGGKLDFFLVFFLWGKAEICIDGEFGVMYVHRACMVARQGL